jgi:DNA-binding CsgD family transcriptional regulator
LSAPPFLALHPCPLVHPITRKHRNAHLPGLTVRERELLERLAEGLSSEGPARCFGLSAILDVT